MKKLLYAFAAVATLLFAASCTQERLEAPAGDTVKATFSIALPDAVGTKAISDGTNADKLLFRAYDENGQLLEGLNQTVDVNGKTATVEVDLVKDLSYQFVFWAQAGEDKYSIANDGTITIVPGNMMNDGSWDAFYWHEPTFQVTGAFVKDITLTRPFAQLNVGAPDGDFSSAQASGIATDAASLKTNYKVKVPNKINLLNGTVSGEAEVTFDSASHPAEKLIVSGTEYDWAAMVYVLAGTEKSTQDVTLELTTTQTPTGGTATPKTFTREIPNVPLQRNYRTNILGRIFTVGGTFNITVDEAFQKVDDYADDYVPEYATIDDLNAAFAAGKAAGYKVAVTTAEDGTIVLPKTNDEVHIFLRGDFSGNTVTIAYAEGATDNEKPAILYITAPKLKELKGDLAATHVEIVTSSYIETGELTTSNNTLVIQQNAYMGVLTIKGGSLKVEGKLDNGTVEATAVGASTVVTPTAEVGTLTVKAGSITVEAKDEAAENTHVELLVIDNTDNTIADVVVNSEANVVETQIIGGGVEVKDETGDTTASSVTVSTEEELLAAIAGEATTIELTQDINLNNVAEGFNGTASTKYNLVIERGLTINGNGHAIKSNNNHRTIGIAATDEVVTLKDITVKASGASAMWLLADNMTVNLDNAVVDGTEHSSANGFGDNWNQVITIGSGFTGIKLNVTNGSVVKTNDDGSAHYAIMAASPAEINVEDATINGWSAVYLKSGADGSKVTIANSTLKSRGYSGYSNAFGMFVTECANNSFTLTNNTYNITALENYDALFMLKGNSGNVINVLGNETQFNTNQPFYGGIAASWGDFENGLNTLKFDEANKELFAPYFDEYCVIEGPTDGLYTVSYLNEVFYYWDDGNGGYEGVYTSISAPFEDTKNFILGNGEYIRLMRNLTLKANITCSITGSLPVGSSLTLTFGEYTITKGEYSIKLPTGVSVITDKATDIFSAAEEGAIITETVIDGKYTYKAGLPANLYWDGETVSEPALNGTTYTIETPAELAWVATQVLSGETFAGKTVVLAKDLDLCGKEWITSVNGNAPKRSSATIANDGQYAFRGTFDGNNKTISNLTITVDPADKNVALGLFGAIYGATVKDVTFADVNLNTTKSAQLGTVCGLMYQSTVDNVSVSGTIKGYQAVGGIAGRILQNGTVKNCVNNAAINGTDYNIGGIIGIGYLDDADPASGKANTRIENCVNKGAISSKTMGVGGIAGLFYGDIVECSNEGAISGVNSIGGIVGEQKSGSVTNSKNSGVITSIGSSGSYGIGGIVGWLRYNQNQNVPYYATEVTVSGCTNSADVIGTSSDAGGIVGTVYVFADIKNNICSAQNLKAANFASGIVGNYQKTEPVTSMGINVGTDEYAALKLKLTGNKVFTPVNLTANLTNTFVYDNTSGAHTVLSGNVEQAR